MIKNMFMQKWSNTFRQVQPNECFDKSNFILRAQGSYEYLYAQMLIGLVWLLLVVHKIRTAEGE